MSATILNPRNRYRPAALIEPSAAGYVHLALEVDPPARPGPSPLTAKGRELLARVAPPLSRLGADTRVKSAGVYRAIGFPPLAAFPVPARYEDVVGRYDLTILIETQVVEGLAGVVAGPAYAELLGLLRADAAKLVVTTAHNVRRIGDVPAEDSLHLFNHFLTENEDALEVWDYLAGWYQREMGMRNSEVLAPVEAGTTAFAFINHASWNISLARFIARQLSRRTFRSFVIANLRANNVGALPYLYHPVTQFSAARHLPERGTESDVLAA
jgi:hypothetical protein